VIRTTVNTMTKTKQKQEHQWPT